mmetsp:Transcript_16441/g.25532  ORF Transcript_16441/g.25532 Transcript_16441/m.25532 type:complete len:177 (+) Transcript_16441:401-931(+)
MMNLGVVSEGQMRIAERAQRVLKALEGRGVWSGSDQGGMSKLLGALSPTAEGTEVQAWIGTGAGAGAERGVSEGGRGLGAEAGAGAVRAAGGRGVGALGVRDARGLPLSLEPLTRLTGRSEGHRAWIEGSRNPTGGRGAEVGSVAGSSGFGVKTSDSGPDPYQEGQELRLVQGLRG